MEGWETKGPGVPRDESDLDSRTRERFEAWRSGDAASAARLFELHHDFLVDLVERELGPKLRSRLEPQDVLQDVGVKLLHYEPKPEDGSVERFRALLKKMTRHVVTDLHRRFFEADKRGGGAERPLLSDSRFGVDPPRGSVTSPSRVFERNEERELARVVLHFLPADRGDLIGLRSWYDVPFATLRERFAADETALRMRLLRAMEKAAAVLAKVRSALPRMDEADRDLIRLRVGGDLSFGSMAALLKSTPIEVCSRFQLAMRRLGKLIDEPFRPLPDDWPGCLLSSSESA